MKNIKVVIGTLFGDEGKGLLTDYFCQLTTEPVLNVRFNGTAQASHTVVFEDKSHIFHSIGAGSFHSNVDTYFSKEFVVNPMALKEEVLEFIKDFHIKPKIYINEECRIATPYDMLLNKEVEDSREIRHGSCGFGFFETIKRYKNSKAYFYLNDDFYEKLDEVIVYAKNISNNPILSSETLKQDFIDALLWVKSYCEIVTDDILDSYDTIVFEGAQGLSLCEDNMPYFPHLTPSQTGIKYVSDILKDRKFNFDLEVCYVVRSYATRHGNGLLKFSCNKEDLGKFVEEKTNITNEFQGSFRFGYLNKEEIEENIQRDLLKLDEILEPIKLTFAITHLDQTNGILKTNEGDIAIKDLKFHNDLYLSYGETAKDIKRQRHK